ncbi:MAG: hypothetical protein V3V81_07485 [Candidatus Bathyarchaeia archaeon]
MLAIERTKHELQLALHAQYQRERVIRDMLPELIELLDELTTKQHFGEPAKEMIAKLKKWRDG